MKVNVKKRKDTKMKIKNIFTRLICFILVVGFILPIIPTKSAFAAEATITKLLWKSSIPGRDEITSNLENDIETEIEISEDEEVQWSSTTSTNNWYLLRYYDNLPYNEIHKRVQQDIWNNNDIEKSELKTNYEDGSYGFADL